MPDKEDPITEEIDVSTIDDISDTAHRHTRARTLDEYSPTNSPLSKDEIDHGLARDKNHTGWAPRTTDDIGDLKPLPEKPLPNQ